MRLETEPDCCGFRNILMQVRGAGTTLSWDAGSGWPLYMHRIYEVQYSPTLNTVSCDLPGNINLLALLSLSPGTPTDPDIVEPS